MESGKVVAGKYRLNQLLGSGGMAEVWSATNTFTERQLAIKFMNMQVAKTPEAAARFLKEAKVSARTLISTSRWPSNSGGGLQRCLRTTTTRLVRFQHGIPAFKCGIRNAEFRIINREIYSAAKPQPK